MPVPRHAPYLDMVSRAGVDPSSRVMLPCRPEGHTEEPQAGGHPGSKTDTAFREPGHGSDRPLEEQRSPDKRLGASNLERGL